MAMVMKITDFVSRNDKLPEECTYCGKATKKCDHWLLPNREFQTSRWHIGCVSRFITDTIFAENIEDYDKYASQILNHLPDSFIPLIDKANAREERYRYKQIVLTV
jgi:hypothetical protein